MKKVFFMIGLLFLSMETLCVAQYVKVFAKPEPVNARRNGIRMGIPHSFTDKHKKDVIVVYKPGYATQGMTVENIMKKGKYQYTFELEKINKPDSGFKSRKIEFTRFTDATERLGYSSYEYNGWYARYNPGIDLGSSKYSKAANAQMAEWGFAMVGTNEVFREGDMADLAIAGEVLSTGETSFGPGFQVSVLVDWSVFDIKKKMVVLHLVTGGYSDSQTRLKFAEELALALRNGLVSLMCDSQFQKLAVLSPGQKQNLTYETTYLPVIAKKNFNGNSEMIKSVINSVVTVKTNLGHGSGFLVSAEGHILTNDHVVSGAEKIEIIFDNGFTFTGKLLKSSELRDVALLKMEGNGFKPLPLDSSEDAPDAGTEVIAVGTPADISLGQTVTKGIISGKRIIEERNYIQTDVPINPGNSGGPLLNTSGEVIGIIVSKVVENYTEGVGFAIPIREACAALSINFQ